MERIGSAGATCLLLVASACTPPPFVPRPVGPEVASTAPAEPERRSFGAAAYVRLVELMALPRGLGDPARVGSIAALEEMLLDLGAPSVRRVETQGDDPKDGTRYALTTLVAHLRPEAARRFVLATHFDTRPWADESADPADRARAVPGANDGTSGVAVVLELLARLPARMPDDVGVSVVLFDGEELGRPGAGGYCMGSRDLARRLEDGEDPTLASAELGVVLDMVGDADLSVPIEPGSLAIHPDLVRHVWATAAALGHTQFSDVPREIGVFDDHRPLTDAGIPSILIIDRDYAAWHTPDDTLAHVSAESLGAVGETVLEALVGWYADPAR